MRQLKIEINALKLQAVSHNTTLLIIPASTLQAALCNYIVVGNKTINYTLKGHTAILVNFHSYTNLRCPLFLESALLLPQGGETIL